MKWWWLLRTHMNFPSTFGSRVHNPCHFALPFLTTTTRNCEDYAKTNNLEDYSFSAVHVELFLKMAASLEGHQRTGMDFSFPVTKCHFRIRACSCVYGDEDLARVKIGINWAADRTAACISVLNYTGWNGRDQLKRYGTRAGEHFVFRRNGRPGSNQAITRK